MTVDPRLISPAPSAVVKGVDPYDALSGTRVPRWLRATPRGRQLAIQLRKRSRFDLAGVLGAPERVMAKAAGCALTAAVRLDTAAGDGSGREEVARCTRLLEGAEGALGGGRYGYEFDVQTRWAYYPAGTPNIVATAFCARALATQAAAYGDAGASAALAESAAWVFSDMLVPAARGPWVRYVPDSDRVVHNASLLGALVLVAGGAVCGEAAWTEAALDVAETACLAQRSDGGWPYGDGPGLTWEDNFHTAYVLGCLHAVHLATGSEAVERALRAGIAHWREAFFGPAGEPYYSPRAHYPLDIHSAATATDVAARLAAWDRDTGGLHERVSEWTWAHLVDPATGLTHYQVTRLGTDRRRFARWGDAHWALARGSLALAAAGERDPLEARLSASRG